MENLHDIRTPEFIGFTGPCFATPPSVLVLMAIPVSAIVETGQ